MLAKNWAWAWFSLSALSRRHVRQAAVLLMQGAQQGVFQPGIFRGQGRGAGFGGKVDLAVDAGQRRQGLGRTTERRRQGLGHAPAERCGQGQPAGADAGGQGG